MSIIRSNNSINPEESYKTIDDYGFDKDALCMFIQNYEVVKELKQENRNGTHFNRVGPNKNITGKGCYYIPYWSRIARRGYRNARNMFYKYCAYHLFYGKMEEYKTGETDNFINFAQYLPKISPLCLDFDIVAKFTVEDRSKFKKGDSIHIYKEEHIFKIVEILNNIIFDNFEVDKDDIKAYVFEKESFKFKSEEEVKDGIHIIYLLPFNIKQRWFIRNELINKLIEINFIKSFDFHITNDYNDIVDEAVITRNPWLTYGSVKVETKTAKDASGNTIYYTNKKGERRKKLNCTRSTAYTLSYIFDFELFDENIDCMGNRLTYETIDDMEAMLNLFDLDQFSNDDPLEEKSDKLINFICEENTKKHKNNTQIPNNYNNQSDYNNQVNYDEKIDYNYNLNKEVLFDIVNVLKKNEDLYTSYQNWYKICCSLYRNSKDCNISDKDIKDAIYKFSSNSKSFNPEEFDDDYDNIIKGASKPNYNYSLKYILDCINEINPDKTKKIKKIVYSNSSKDNNLTNSFSFNNYKNNNLYIMDSSDFDKKSKNTYKFLDDEDIDEFYDKFMKEDVEDKTIIEELDYPKHPYDPEFRYVIYSIQKNHITLKEQIDEMFCNYIEKYIVYIKNSGTVYYYDWTEKKYLLIREEYLDNNVSNDPVDFVTYNEKNKPMHQSIKPFKVFKNYEKNNGWVSEYNINNPKKYIETKYENGEKFVRKVFNNGPIVPKYLVENYKHYDEYDKIYKDWVQDIFELIKYSLCSDNEKIFEYFKNWIINKILFIRNKTNIVLQSLAQGIGKTTIISLFEKMFGSEYAASSNQCEWMSGSFNGELENKILYGIEELKQTKEKNDWYNAQDLIKSLEHDTIKIHRKYKDPVFCPNYIDFIITSNHYNKMLLERDNRRYFIPTVISTKDKKIKKLVKRINSILVGNKTEQERLRPLEEKQKYYRCFYAYCKENFNKDFNSMDIPITDAIITNNDLRMDLEFKYIKAKLLYEKKYLSEYKIRKNGRYDSKYKEGDKVFKIVFEDLKIKLLEFVKDLEMGGDRLLNKYYYCQQGLNNFKHDKMIRDEINIGKVKDNLLDKIGEEYQCKLTVPGYDGYQGILISYDELLEIYRDSGYVDDFEYNKLKGNYEKIKYCNDDYKISSSLSYSSQIEELKQKMEDKDNLINKYIDEIKEKDNMIESLKSFTNEQKDKEIEKLNAKIKELEELLNTKDNVITENNNVVDSKDKEIEELNAKIKELEEITNAKDNAITEDKEIEKSNDTVKENDNTNINKYRETMNKDIKDITIQTLRSIANECKIELDKHIFKYKKQELYDLLKNYFNNY